MQRPVVLVGFMATGKSKIGRILAERLKLQFVDSDKMIEDRFGLSVAEIFSDHGEAAFRSAERETIADLMAGDARIVALGGGAFVDPETRDLLGRVSRVVWLDTPFDLLWPRLTRSDKRPLAANRSEADLRALCEQRRQYYGQAHIRIDCSSDRPEDTVHQILDALDALDAPP